MRWVKKKIRIETIEQIFWLLCISLLATLVIEPTLQQFLDFNPKYLTLVSFGGIFVASAIFSLIVGGLRTLQPWTRSKKSPVPRQKKETPEDFLNKTLSRRWFEIQNEEREAKKKKNRP